MIEIKQSTASYALVFEMRDSTTNLPKTGLTVTATLSKNGGTFASASGSVTEIGNGLYKVAANSTDSNTLGVLAVFGAATGAYCLPMAYAVVANLESDTYTRIGAPVGASISADIAAVAAGVWAVGSRTLTAISDSSGITTLLSRIASALTITSGNVTVGTNNDKTGYALATAPPTAAATATAVRTELATELARIDVATSTRNATTPPTASAIADQVWDEVLSGHLTSGTTGAGLNAAGAAGDPWSTTLPGAYGAGTAGKILGTNLDATVSSRSSHNAAAVWSATTRTLSAFSFTVSTNANATETAIKAKTDNLPSNPASVGDIPSVVSISSAVWGEPLRTLTSSSDSPGVTTLLSDTSTLLTRIPSALSISSGQVTIGTNNDKTGYALVAPPLTASGTRAALGMASANLDTQIGTLATSSALATTDAVADSTLAIAQKLDTAMELDGAVYRYTANALEQAPAGGGGGSGLPPDVVTALENADQILLAELYVPTEQPAIIIDAPEDPLLCRAYMFTERIIGVAQEGLTMTIKVASPPAKSGKALGCTPEPALTDEDGYVFLDIVRGAKYRVTMPSIGMDTTFTPDDATFDISTLIP